MKLFYHHVGQKGADEDFKKTVFTRVSIDEVRAAVPGDNPSKDGLLAALEREFPGGTFNCWGVPERADVVIRNLSPGDAVLLVESVRVDGMIPALCLVKVFVGEELWQLSHALWGDEKYPRIFFFDTERIALSWVEFATDLGFAPNYDPRGKFYSVSEGRLQRLGGAAGYVARLRARFGAGKALMSMISTTDIREETSGQPGDYGRHVSRALDDLAGSLDGPPQLTGSATLATTVATSFARSAAFRIMVRKIYGNRCAVCGTMLMSPDGKHEVQAAHIFPKEHDGSDDPRNGICLCRFHHWAFDVGWFALTDDLRVLVRHDLHQDAAYDDIRRFAGRTVTLPSISALRPHPMFLAERRRLFSF